jgi:hypothetical protein
VAIASPGASAGADGAAVPSSRCRSASRQGPVQRAHGLNPFGIEAVGSVIELCAGQQVVRIAANM